MVIAINTRSLYGNNEMGKFIVNSFIKLAETHPAHTFVFISNESFGGMPALKNVETVILPQQSQTPLLWKLWYNYKLPAALKKCKASVVVHPDIVCSLRTKIHQFIIVNDLLFLDQPGWIDKKYARFARTNANAFFQKVKKVFTGSVITTNKIADTYKLDDQKTELLYPFAENSFLPLHWKEKEQVKEKYADGKEYFLFAGSVKESSNLINLLKAFSFFKKRQKSNMQLLIAYPSTDDDKIFKESLRLYKYRQDVKLQKGLSEWELKKIITAAYAFVYPVLNETFHPVLNTMQSEVPAIVSKSEVSAEIFDDAVLYADSNNFEDIAQQMMLLFKDENTRNELISKAKQKATGYTMERTSEILWKNITETTA